MWHSVASLESCCMYQISSVGVRSWSSSQSSASSVFFPACFRARTARAVSRMLPQWSFACRSSSSATHSSKMLSGVARMVSATSWVDSDEQSSAFSSRHSNPSSILSGSCCEDVDEELDESSVVSIVHSSLSQISPESQSLVTVQLSPSVASASGTSRNVRNRMRNTPVFFMC